MLQTIHHNPNQRHYHDKFRQNDGLLYRLSAVNGQQNVDFLSELSDLLFLYQCQVQDVHTKADNSPLRREFSISIRVSLASEP